VNDAWKRTRRALLLAASLGLAACESLVPVAGGPTDAGPPPAGLASEFVNAQNAVRAGASPTPVPALAAFLWSPDAASVAQSWANGCTYQHNAGRGSYGENIAANYPPGSRTAADIVALWASEASSYDYGSNACSGVCGHYTQIVWRTTTAVGCAKATCPGASSPFGNGQSWDFWVCDYAPPGNVVGQRPY
jgi:uncharacterized protein YkwD